MYFCADRCLDKFVKDPPKYIGGDSVGPILSMSTPGSGGVAKPYLAVDPGLGRGGIAAVALALHPEGVELGLQVAQDGAAGWVRSHFLRVWSNRSVLPFVCGWHGRDDRHWSFSSRWTSVDSDCSRRCRAGGGALR